MRKPQITLKYILVLIAVVFPHLEIATASQIGIECDKQFKKNDRVLIAQYALDRLSYNPRIIKNKECEQDKYTLSNQYKYKYFYLIEPAFAVISVIIVLVGLYGLKEKKSKEKWKGKSFAEWFYHHRYGFGLFWLLFVIAVFLLHVIAPILNILHIDLGQLSSGPIITALMASPILGFIWLVRTFERERELNKEEWAVWSDEFHKIIEMASGNYREQSDTTEKINIASGIAPRLTAIRRCQEYLNGLKWERNRGANSIAVFSLFSAIVQEAKESFIKELELLEIDWNDKSNYPPKENPKYAKLVEKYQKRPEILAIGNILRSTFNKEDGKDIVVTERDLSGMRFDFLDISDISFKGLVLNFCTFDNTIATHAIFDDTHLQYATLKNSIFKNSTFNGATFNHTYLEISSNEWSDKDRPFAFIKYVSQDKLVEGDPIKIISHKFDQQAPS